MTVKVYPVENLYQSSERIAPWASKPEVQRKLLEKLGEFENELKRAHGAAQGLKRTFLKDLNDGGREYQRKVNELISATTGTDTPATANSREFERNVNELKGWVESLVESMAYFSKMLRTTYGASNFKAFALAAMHKGDVRATNDARIAGIRMSDSQIDYSPPDMATIYGPGVVDPRYYETMKSK